jgi:hypothetical protein
MPKRRENYHININTHQHNSISSALEMFYSNNTALVDNKFIDQFTTLKVELEALDYQPSPPQQAPELQPFVDRCQILCKEIGINADLM